MIIALIIAIPVTALVTGFFVLKAVQLGLRWQMETKEARPPTMESPVKPVVGHILDHIQRKQESKQVELNQSIYDEWVNGAKEG